jgi:hypothetical protein
MGRPIEQWVACSVVVLNFHFVGFGVHVLLHLCAVWIAVCMRDAALLGGGKQMSGFCMCRVLDRTRSRWSLFEVWQGAAASLIVLCISTL